jgi:hypothetical protein
MKYMAISLFVMPFFFFGDLHAMKKDEVVAMLQADGQALSKKIKDSEFPEHRSPRGKQEFVQREDTWVLKNGKLEKVKLEKVDFGKLAVVQGTVKNAKNHVEIPLSEDSSSSSDSRESSPKLNGSPADDSEES